MESSELEKGRTSPEDVGHLSRNRSFKSKQLVRSQAIRESQSPPRTVSPNRTEYANESAAIDIDTSDSIIDTTSPIIDIKDRTLSDVNTSSQVVVNSFNNNNIDIISDVFSDNNKGKSDFGDDTKKAHSVEIQITSGAWELDHLIDQRQRTKRWLGNRHYSDSYDLLSNNPRVTCVCGGCRPRARQEEFAARPRTCPDCRGRRRKQTCPAKQDSGIVCSDECPDCSDSENNDPSPPRPRKAESLDVDQTEVHTCRCLERSDKPKNMLSSRTNSGELYDKPELTGQELINFIKDTLNKNVKDRMTLLKIEKELHSLVSDPGRCIVRFPVMTSYGRMLVHRCASLFELTHNLDQYNKSSVLVSKSGTCGGRIPCTSFRAWCTVNFPHSTVRDMQAKSILKRDSHSLDESVEGNGGHGAAMRSKSLEQREREYERVRRRIFSSEDAHHPWLTPGQVKLLTPEPGKNRLLKVQSLESSSPSQPSRGAVAKSHSFGGYDPQPQPTRLLSRQGDLASSSWRLSPSSSGYKTLSLRSTDSVTPSPTGGVSPEPAAGCSGPLVWAVTDLSEIPAGALIIHPQTGCPLTNADGSVYHYDPKHPPIFDTDSTQREEIKMESAEKRRGRLEKQHSFMENEYDCQDGEYASKECCCECKQVDWNEQLASPPESQPCDGTDKETTQLSESDTNQEVSPQCEEQPCEAPTNQRAPPVAATNQVTPLVEQDGGRYNDNGYTEEYIVEEVQNVHNEEPNPEFVQSVPTSPAKTALPYHDSDIREMPISGPVYSTAINPNGYTYTDQCRIDQQLQPLYQHINMPADERKTPQLSEPTFRIDQSYPYVPQPLSDAHQPYVPLSGQYGYGHVIPCAGACGLDPVTGLSHCLLNAQRGYGLPYGQPLDAGAVLPPSYPVSNVILPHPQLHQYPYSQTMQWPILTQAIPSTSATPLQKSTSPPNLYLPQPELPIYHQQLNYTKQPEIINYPINGQLYPIVQYPNVSYPYANCPMLAQVVPQYPMCHQVEQRRASGVRSYDGAQRYTNSKKNSISGSSRTTPLESCTPPAMESAKFMPHESVENKARIYKQGSFNENNYGNDVRRKTFHRSNSMRNDYSLSRQGSNELAIKIQQIKEQMASLNANDADNVEKRQSDRHRGYEETRQRNRNPGILGSYPTNNHYNNRIFHQRHVNDESQLSSAARAIVNSIRHIQAKNNYHDYGRRCDYSNENNSHYRYNNNKDNFEPNNRYQKRDRYDRGGHMQNHRQIDNTNNTEKRQNDIGDSVTGNEDAGCIQSDAVDKQNVDQQLNGENKNTVEQPKNSKPEIQEQLVQARTENQSTARSRPVNNMAPFAYRPPYMVRQVNPGWSRRSPGPLPHGMNQRRPPRR